MARDIHKNLVCQQPLLVLAISRKTGGIAGCLLRSAIRSTTSDLGRRWPRKALKDKILTEQPF